MEPGTIISVRDGVGLACGYALAFGLLFFAEAMRRCLGWPLSVTRKLVHVGAGMLVWGLLLLFDHWYVGIVPFGTFIILNLFFHRRQTFRSLGDQGSSLGTVYFAFSTTVLFVLFWRTGGDVDNAPIAVAAVMAMTWGDSAAALVGERWGRHRYRCWGRTRSWEGTLAMAVASFAAVAATLLFLPGSALSPSSTVLSPSHAVCTAIVVSSVAALAEAVSPEGTDNLTVPFLSAATVFVLYSAGASLPTTRIIVGCALSAAVAAVAYRREWLSECGAAAAFVVGSVVFGLGSWVWALVLLTFFATSSALSRHRREDKRAIAEGFEKGSRRDCGQVLANGGLACVVATMFALHPSQVWFAAFLGAMAAVTADTWATEIGVLAGRAPRLVTTWRTVVPGTSGGVSLAGVFATVAGALVIGTAAQVFVVISGGRLEPRIVAASAVGGLVGSLTDSLLGATLQGQYYSEARKRESERASQTGRTTHSGAEFAGWETTWSTS